MNARCGACQRIFKDHNDFRQHAKDAGIHRELKYSPCDKVFETLDLLADHLLNASQHAARTKCKSCQRVFKDQQELDQHRNEDHPDSRGRVTLQNHLHTRHPEILNNDSSSSKATTQQVPIEGEKKTPKSSKSKFPCSYCPLVFEYHHLLRLHQDLMHGPTIEKLHCPFCYNTFPDKYLLEAHQQAAHGPQPEVRCLVCDAPFKGYEVAFEHLEVHRKALRRSQIEVNCFVCNEAFKSYEAAFFHLRNSSCVVPAPAANPSTERSETEEREMDLEDIRGELADIRGELADSRSDLADSKSCLQDADTKTILIWCRYCRTMFHSRAGFKLHHPCRVNISASADPDRDEEDLSPSDQYDDPTGDASDPSGFVPEHWSGFGEEESGWW